MNSKKRKAQYFRLPIWKDFTPVEVDGGDPLVKVRKGKCNHYRKLIATHARRNGTTSTHHHLESCLKKRASNSNQKTLSFQPSASGDGTGSLTSWNFD